MEQIKKSLFGLTYFILKINIIIAAIALMKLEPVHFITTIPLYQIVGGVLLAFLAYLELYEYFTKSVKSKKQKSSALDKFKLKPEATK